MRASGTSSQNNSPERLRKWFTARRRPRSGLRREEAFRRPRLARGAAAERPSPRTRQSRARGRARAPGPSEGNGEDESPGVRDSDVALDDAGEFGRVEPVERQEQAVGKPRVEPVGG